MEKDTDIIRTEILRVLNESGRIRGTELAKRVIKKMGSEKIVYREISTLVQAGEIEKMVRDRTHIEYELVDLSESASTQLKNIHVEISRVFGEINDFGDACTKEEEKLSFHERQRIVICLIHAVQSTNGVMKLLSYYPTFKKDRMFPQINRMTDDCWQNIISIIMHQQETEFLNEVLANLLMVQSDSKNVN